MRWTQESADLAETPLSLLTTLTPSTGPGNDRLTLDASNGPIPPARVLFNGGGGSDTLNIRGGVFVLNSDAMLSSDALTTNLNNAATLSVNSTQHLAALNITGSSRVELSAGGTRFLRTGSLSLSPDATLDLADNDLIIDNGDIADIVTGIKFRRIIGKPGKCTALAAILNDKDDKAHTPVTNSFAGETVLATDVLVKYTWAGDANLDGMVNADDYGLIDRGFISQKRGWYNGDFNYDTFVNADDYGMIDRAFVEQTGTLAVGAAESSPQPAQVPAAPAALNTVTPKRDLDSLLSQLFSTAPVLG